MAMRLSGNDYLAELFIPVSIDGHINSDPDLIFYFSFQFFVGMDGKAHLFVAFNSAGIPVEYIQFNHWFVVMGECIIQ
jgi:hypothetical protein